MKRPVVFAVMLLIVSLCGSLHARDFVNISVQKKGDFIVVKPLDNSRQMLAIRKDKILVVKVVKALVGRVYNVRIIVDSPSPKDERTYNIGLMPYEVAVNALMHILELSRTNE